MQISFTLNGNPVSLDLPPHKRLIDVLRQDLGLQQTLPFCYTGFCGHCSVLMNDEVVHACMVTAFAARDEEIITIEGFSKTSAYRNIMESMGDAGCIFCDACITNRIFAIHALLEAIPNPDPNEIAEFLGNYVCNCVDFSTMVQGVKAAANQKRWSADVRKK